MRGVHRSRDGLGGAAGVPDVWPRRVLRRFAAPSRHRAFPGHAASGHADSARIFHVVLRARGRGKAPSGRDDLGDV